MSYDNDWRPTVDVPRHFVWTRADFVAWCVVSMLAGMLLVIAAWTATLAINTRSEDEARVDAASKLGEPVWCDEAPHDWTCAGRSTRRVVECPRDAEAPCRWGIPRP